MSGKSRGSGDRNGGALGGDVGWAAVSYEGGGSAGAGSYLTSTILTQFETFGILEKLHTPH